MLNTWPSLESFEFANREMTEPFPMQELSTNDAQGRIIFKFVPA